MSETREHEQSEGWTENDQQQEPEPSRDATVYVVAAEKRGKYGTIRHYIMAPDGSLLHSSRDALMPVMKAAISAGYRKVVAEELEAKGDHFARIFTVTMTPPKRGAPARRPPSREASA